MEMADWMDWVAKKIGKKKYSIVSELREEMDIVVSNPSSMKYSPDPSEGSQGIKFQTLGGLWVLAKRKGVKADEFLDKIVEIFLGKQFLDKKKDEKK